MILQRGGVTGDLERAEEEAARFLAATRALRGRLAESERVRQYGHITGSPESAAVRRASLDLSRALAKMRRRN